VFTGIQVKQWRGWGGRHYIKSTEQTLDMINLFGILYYPAQRTAAAKVSRKTPPT
jgi:hypothetical protein